jgi:rhamnose transport system ATP-binding protein
MSAGIPVLRAEALIKSFDGIQALRGASFELRSGEVHALIGENGAGKSTLIKVITGAVQPDSGEVFLHGKLLHPNSTRIAKAAGIAAIYQQPALFPALSVAENIALGLEERTLWSRVDWSARDRHAAALLKRVGSNIDPSAEAGSLSMPEQQLVEIARAIGANARVVIMDEPTASLSERESENLYQVIGDLRKQGVGIIYISHRLQELPKLANRVTVLRDGNVIETRDMATVSQDELIRMMVGRELSNVFPKKDVAPGNIVLEVNQLRCRAAGIHDVSVSIRAGEIVGLAGLVGSGRTELARTIFGLTPADSGEIKVYGRAVEIRGPRDAVACGIAYVPEDRLRHGVVPQFPISANITLAILERLKRLGGIDFAEETRLATEYVRRLRIKTSSIWSAAGSLSGGNQQKVALSRWLATNPSVLMLDEPTQGIDVGSKAEIHSLIGELAARGMAVLVISSELPEILGISDRIAVMHAGTIASVLSRTAATQEAILRIALGHPAVDNDRRPAQSEERP